MAVAVAGWVGVSSPGDYAAFKILPPSRHDYYGLQRQLVEMGHDCIAVAPSLIPVKAGETLAQATDNPTVRLPAVAT